MVYGGYDMVIQSYRYLIMVVDSFLWGRFDLGGEVFYPNNQAVRTYVLDKRSPEVVVNY